MEVFGYSVYLHNSYAVLVPDYDRRKTYSNRQSENSFLLSEINSNVRGNLSKNAARRLRNYCNLLAYLSPWKTVISKDKHQRFRFKLNFVTLDIVPNLPASEDRFIKRKLLQPFLEHFKRSHNLKNYIWKAEVQARGAIHFHVTTDKYIHYQEIRKVWNKLQYKNGLLQDFFKRYGNFDPNSTDVHSVKSLNDYAAYMVKYFTKTDSKRRKIEGKIWDCSNHLKRLNWPVLETGYGDHSEIEHIFKHLGNNIKQDDYFSIVFYRSIQEFNKLPGRWQKELKSWKTQEQIKCFMRD